MTFQKAIRLSIALALTVLILNACSAPAPTSTTRSDANQPVSEEQYEAITTTDFEPNMQLSGEIRWDRDGLVNGGPVDSFSFWGHDIALTSNMITEGFLSTKDYGKILIKANSNGSMHIELTPSQQTKIKQLK